MGRQERCLRFLREFDRFLWERHGRQASTLPLLDHRKSLWYETTGGLGAKPLPPGFGLLERSERSYQGSSFIKTVEDAAPSRFLAGQCLGSVARARRPQVCW